jgi:hypothetical protein
VRYLWTDAHAVCNWLGLYTERADPEALKLALELVEETHRVLGRHRPDDSRRGWLSGLGEELGARHPTLGGLRIGKRLPERAPGEPFDAQLEWDRDGQYFHYLTRWMSALESVARVTDDERYRSWAVELARTAYDRFAVLDDEGWPIGLRWKMSIDLGRPLVASMGRHDALDGFLVYHRLVARAAPGLQDDLAHEIEGLSRLCGGRDWFTDDALGIGGLLVDAHTLAGLMAGGRVNAPELLAGLLESAAAGLHQILQRRELDAPAERRLAFRELGLAIGLKAVGRIGAQIERAPRTFGNRDALRSILDALGPHVERASAIEQFWLQPDHRRASTWVDHLDINEVMLASSLAPAGVLEI